VNHQKLESTLLADIVDQQGIFVALRGRQNLAVASQQNVWESLASVQDQQTVQIPPRTSEHRTSGKSIVPIPGECRVYASDVPEEEVPEVVSEVEHACELMRDSAESAVGCAGGSRREKTTKAKSKRKAKAKAKGEAESSPIRQSMNLEMKDRGARSWRSASPRVFCGDGFVESASSSSPYRLPALDTTEDAALPLLCNFRPAC